MKALTRIPIFSYNTIATTLVTDSKSLEIKFRKKFINLETLFELESILAWSASHPEVQSLYITVYGDHFIQGIDPEEFIKGHKNPYDFMLRAEIPRSSKLVMVDEHGVDHQTQNICRYYISDKGMDLVKVMPPVNPTKEEQVWVNHELMDEVVISSKVDIAKYEKKGYVFSKTVETPCPDRRLGIEAGWKCKVTNDMDSFDWDINYQYYIERTWKLIDFADENNEGEDDTE